METIEKLSSFLTLISLPILGPALGRFLFDLYARRRNLPEEPTFLASRVTLMISLAALLSLYGIVWNADPDMVAWFKWGNADLPVYANAEVSGEIGANVSGDVKAEVSGDVDANVR